MNGLAALHQLDGWILSNWRNFSNAARLAEEGCGIDDRFLDPETGETLTSTGVLGKMGRAVAIEAGTTVAGGVPGKVIKKLPGKKLRVLWQKYFKKKWPKDPKNPCRNQDACHKKPWVDNKTDPNINNPTNIEPKPHDDHRLDHIKAGDFMRWGGRRGSE